MDGQIANYISLKDAAVFCDHSPEYLNLLVRKGKLKAVKIGRNWVTKKEWIENYLSANRAGGKLGGYISLKEAENFCAYSQDYLNLLVRKNKLMALKIGRNWVTKKEWLQNYLETVGEKKVKCVPVKFFEPVKNEVSVGLAAKLSADILPVEKEEDNPENPVNHFAILDGTAPLLSAPKPLPESLLVVEVPRPRRAPAAEAPKKKNILVPGLVFLCVSIMALAVSVLSGLGVFNKAGGDLASVAGGVISYSRLAAERTAIVAVSAGQANIFQGIGRAFETLVSAGRGTAQKLAGFVDYLFNGRTERSLVLEGQAVPVDETVLDKSLQVLENNITGDTRERFDEFRNEFGINAGLPATSTIGMIVVSSSGDEENDEKMKDEIKRNFSDEVAVRPKDDESGVVVPQFREREGDEYIYMMVPMPKSGTN